jgi:hypothetical protein
MYFLSSNSLAGVGGSTAGLKVGTLVVMVLHSLSISSIRL